MTPGDRAREDRDGIQAKIDALDAEQRICRLKRSSAATYEAYDAAGERLDAISDEIAALEAELDDADDEVRRVDPERSVYGRDGL